MDGFDMTMAPNELTVWNLPFCNQESIVFHQKEEKLSGHDIWTRPDFPTWLGVWLWHILMLVNQFYQNCLYQDLTRRYCKGGEHFVLQETFVAWTSSSAGLSQEMVILLGSVWSQSFFFSFWKTKVKNYCEKNWDIFHIFTVCACFLTPFNRSQFEFSTWRIWKSGLAVWRPKMFWGLMRRRQARRTLRCNSVFMFRNIFRGFYRGGKWR